MIWTHLSELAIDKLLAGEVAAVDAVAMRSHAADCAACGTRLDEALEVQRAFAFERPALPIVVPRQRPRHRAIIAATGALAAALALVWLMPSDRPATIRTKGDAIAGFFVKHDGVVRRGGMREPVMTGDRIELTTTTATAGWFAATSEDGAGRRSVYVAPREIEAGRERVVPLSIELDDTPGEETVSTVFCAERFELDRIPAGCTVDRFVLVKVPR